MAADSEVGRRKRRIAVADFDRIVVADFDRTEAAGPDTVNSTARTEAAVVDFLGNPTARAVVASGRRTAVVDIDPEQVIRIAEEGR